MRFPRVGIWRSASWLVGLVGVIVLAGCASPYGKASGGSGYSDARLAPNLHEVSFMGKPSMSGVEAKKYATWRAAELCVMEGYDRFKVERSFVELRRFEELVPPRTTLERRKFKNKHGKWVVRTFERYEPGYTRVYTRPEAVLRVRFFTGGRADGNDALGTLDRARMADKHIKFAPPVEALLGPRKN